MQLTDKKRALLEKLMQQEGLASEVAQNIPYLDHDGVAPLSFSQERLWFLSQMHPDSPVYNFPAAVRLTGPLDEPALKNALDKVIRKHDILRAFFNSSDQGPVQKIMPAIELDLTENDLRALPVNEREPEAFRFANSELRKPFSLAQAPLFRVSLIRVHHNEVIFLLVIHHIIAEAWSVSILFRELELFYLAEVNGKAIPQLTTSIQYADYSHWQRQQMQGDILENNLQYWRKQLQGELPVLQLPTDRPRPSTQTMNGAWVSCNLPADLHKGLMDFSNEQGVTLFMTLLAGYLILLSKYTGQNDIIIGSPIAGRTKAETENLIGLLVNTLVLRVNLSGNQDFVGLVKRVQQVCLGAFNHQEIPFEKLVEDIQPERNLGNTPLFQVMFALQNSPAPFLNLAGMQPGRTLTPNEIHNQTSKVDQALFVEETAAGLNAAFEFNTDLFDHATISRLLVHYQTILTNAVEKPQRRLSDLELLTAVERKQILVDWCATQRDFNNNYLIQELVEKQASTRPEAIAAVYDGRCLTYSELNSRANQLAYFLRQSGVGPETIVAVCCERNLFMLTAMLGVLKAGGAYLPLDPAYPRDRINFMLHDANVAVLLTQTHLKTELPVGKFNTICLDQDLETIAGEKTTNPTRVTQPENLAYVIYTSGSTGLPKGVAVTHANLLNLVFWHQTAFNITSDDRASQIATAAFDASVWEIWPYLATGAGIFPAPLETLASPETLQDWIIKNGITISFVPTPLAELLLNLSWPDDVELHTLLTGGDKLHIFPSPDLPFKLINNYGPTENTVVTTSGDVAASKDSGTTPTIGRAITNTEVYLLDGDLNPVAVGIAGEICISGTSLARGYLDRPDLTAEKFSPNPFIQNPGARLYRTGDLARYLPDGQIEFLGRIDHQVKIRGFRIEPGEIETVLEKNPGVEKAIVVVHEAGPADQRLVAYIQTRNAHSISSDGLRQSLAASLPKYMVPAAYVFLEKIPLTSNGKIDRKALPAPDNLRSDFVAKYVAPETGIERKIAAVWQEVLKIEKVGINDNFFDLGGHSLLLMQIHSKLQDVLKRDISMVDLFKYPTVGALTNYYSRKDEDRIELSKMHHLVKKQKQAIEQHNRVMTSLKK